MLTLPSSLLVLFNMHVYKYYKSLTEVKYMYHITVCVSSIQPLFNFVKFHPGLVMDSNASETHGDK